MKCKIKNDSLLNVSNLQSEYYSITLRIQFFKNVKNKEMAKNEHNSPKVFFNL